MDYRNPPILKYIRKLTALMRLRNELAVLIYIILSPLLVVIEKIINAFKRREVTLQIDKITQKNKGIKPTMKKFNDLSESEKRSYGNYYEKCMVASSNGQRVINSAYSTERVTNL